jgi:alpha-glucosidase
MSRFVRHFVWIAWFCVLLVVSGGAAAQGWQHIGKVTKVEKLPDGVELLAGKARVRITAFNNAIVRVRVAPSGVFPRDFSWAVIETPQPPPVKIEDAKEELRMTAGDVVVRVNKSPLLINFSDASGNTLLADEATLPMAWDGERVHVWKDMPQDEMFFGLGDKAGPMNRRNRSFTNWNTDEFGWQESSDPLYKTIPFFIGVQKGISYGLFFDNTYRSSFDFGKEAHDYFSFGAEGGEINYYFLAGPEPKKIVEEFTSLVGRTPLPPLWTLGYQQSRYTYYPETRAYEIVNKLRADNIPCDAIYFDIDFQQGNAPFTVNRQDFPTFEKMISDFKNQGIHTVLITDLHIKKDPNHGYMPYDTGMKDDVFVKSASGSVYVGTVWPGPSVFPDFTLTRVRDWWGGLYRNFVNMGVAGFWNDMNEPAVFLTPTKTMPLDNVHRLDDGTTLPHTAIHNVYGMENVRATHDGLLKLRPNERPFVLTRAAYAGTERYAATWTGDNSSTWNHLKMSTPMLLSMGLSGYGFVGDDIGGFAGSPQADLLTRWFEVGAFNPIFRDHTAKGTADQEPWVHGPEHEAIRRRYIEERYKLLPYLYTSVEEMSRTGIPLMRPVFLDYPKALEFYGNDRDFLFGPDLFVAPVTTDMVDPETIRLPPGDWYDYWTSEKHSGKENITLRPALGEMPLYVRAGAILPMQPLVQSTSENPDGPLELRVYPGPDCRGTLYQDDGHTLQYEKGELLRVNFSCQASPSSISVSSTIATNAYQPWWNSTEVTVFAAPRLPREVRVDHKVAHEWRYDGKAHTVIVTVPDALRDWSVQVLF